VRKARKEAFHKEEHGKSLGELTARGKNCDRIHCPSPGEMSEKSEGKELITWEGST